MTETTHALEFDRLKEAVKGSAAAFRCRRRLQPAGGEGDKVFPPTFAGAVAVEPETRPRRSASSAPPLPSVRQFPDALPIETAQVPARVLRGTRAPASLTPTAGGEPPAPAFPARSG